ncbi:MAG: PKD domain-containing protein, partial [Candidatus Hydrogenedentes bacterium]|nr:PKD domain-containing protein [Candidatus Hydrogenedentota bacterium]
NYSNLGAGIYSVGNITVINSLFAGNRAVGAITCGGFDCPSDVPDRNAGFGGGLYCSGTESVVIGSTFSGNTAAKRGAGMHMNGILRNSISWGNFDYQPPGEDPTPLIDAQIHGNVDVEYSDVQALFQTIPGEDPPEPANFPGCLDTDPMFADPQDGNYRLAANSPCIDAADIEGKPRFIDSPFTADTGSGVAPLVDMGAYEFLPEGAANLPPVPRFSYSPDGYTVRFTDTSSDFDGQVVAWLWDFGDGATSDAMDPEHTYAGNGPYTVTWTVWDDESAAGVSEGVELSLAAIPQPLHVLKIRLRAVPVGEQIRVIAKVFVRDESDSPVPGAMVNGTFTLPNGMLRARSASTNGKGIATLRVKNWPGTYTLSVDDVTLEGYVLDPATSQLSASKTFN